MGLSREGVCQGKAAEVSFSVPCKARRLSRARSYGLNAHGRLTTLCSTSLLPLGRPGRARVQFLEYQLLYKVTLLRNTMVESPPQNLEMEPKLTVGHLGRGSFLGGFLHSVKLKQWKL